MGRGGFTQVKEELPQSHLGSPPAPCFMAWTLLAAGSADCQGSSLAPEGVAALTPPGTTVVSAPSHPIDGQQA